MLLYGYLFYPLIIIAISKFKNNILNPDDSFKPDVTIIISAYNEEDYIEDAVRSVFQSDYPNEKIKLLVGLDGTNDNSLDILRRLSNEYENLEYCHFERIGKNKVLNNLIQKAETEILFFMDADIRIRSHTLSILCSYLANEGVGAAISSMVSIGKGTQSAGGFGEILYQKIERFFRIYESRIFSTVNALGAFYGVKRQLYESLPDDTVADDFYPLLICMQKRKRVLFIADAIVDETRTKSTEDEIQRRIRASASAMSALGYVPELLTFKFGWVSYFLWSHKIFRWMAPLFLFNILLLTPLIENTIILYVLLIVQIYLYFGAFIGWIFERNRINLILLKLPLYALSMNIGFVGAFFRFISKKANSYWER